MHNASATKVHLVTVVGSHVELLPHTLSHYTELGVDSLMVCVHLDEYCDPLYSAVCNICQKYSANVVGVYAGKWLRCVNQFLYHEARHAHPDDWFLLADVDELQVYPSDIHELLESLSSDGYDSVEGCLIDRIATDGGFPKVESNMPIWQQFPLGGMITSPILGGDMRKVVAVKGILQLVSGQHFALEGNGCPREKLYVPAFHFKWTAGVVERLERRADFYRNNQDPIWVESQRFIDYYRQHDNRIDVADPNFFIADCSNGYPQWDIVKELMIAQSRYDGRSAEDGRLIRS